MATQTEHRDAAFREKWKHRLFSPPKSSTDSPWTTDGNGSSIDLLGIPPSWYDVLDKTLTQIEKQHPNFRIIQLKLKLGTVRIHLTNIPPNQIKEIKSALNAKLKTITPA